MRLFRRLSSSGCALAVLALAACGDGGGAAGGGGSGAGGGAGAAPDVVRPQATEPLVAQVSQIPLPPELRGDAALRLAVAGDGTLVGGGAHGLYRLGDAATQISNAPVRALAATRDGVLVATDLTLHLWKGGDALSDSPLGRLLAGSPPLSLAMRGDEVWIGASDALHVVGATSTLRFADLPAVSRIATFAGSGDLVLAGPAALRVLRQTMTTFQTNQLDDEVPMLDAVPAPGGRVLGVAAGALVERVAVTGGGAWRPVALDKDVLVTVEDEGSGVPPEVREAIFNRFHSIRPDGETFGRHSGLGLSIAKAIVEGHDGHIGVEDRHGGRSGGRFVLRFRGV